MAEFYEETQWESQASDFADASEDALQRGSVHGFDDGKKRCGAHRCMDAHRINLAEFFQTPIAKPQRFRVARQKGLAADKRDPWRSVDHLHRRSGDWSLSDQARSAANVQTRLTNEPEPPSDRAGEPLHLQSICARSESTSHREIRTKGLPPVQLLPAGHGLCATWLDESARQKLSNRWRYASTNCRQRWIFIIPHIMIILSFSR